jgi:hypothetical protein
VVSSNEFEVEETSSEPPGSGKYFPPGSSDPSPGPSEISSPYIGDEEEQIVDVGTDTSGGWESEEQNFGSEPAGPPGFVSDPWEEEQIEGSGLGNEFTTPPGNTFSEPPGEIERSNGMPDISPGGDPSTFSGGGGGGGNAFAPVPPGGGGNGEPLPGEAWPYLEETTQEAADRKRWMIGGVAVIAASIGAFLTFGD